MAQAVPAFNPSHNPSLEKNRFVATCLPWFYDVAVSLPTTSGGVNNYMFMLPKSANVIRGTAICQLAFAGGTAPDQVVGHQTTGVALVVNSLFNEADEIGDAAGFVTAVSATMVTGLLSAPLINDSEFFMTQTYTTTNPPTTGQILIVVEAALPLGVHY